MIELNKWYKAEERGSRAVQDVDFDAYNTVLHLVKIYDVENDRFYHHIIGRRALIGSETTILDDDEVHTNIKCRIVAFQFVNYKTILDQINSSD